MSRFLTIAVNEFLPITKYAGDDGAYPEKAEKGHKAHIYGKVCGGTAAYECLISEKYGDEFEDIRRRWEDKKEKHFRRVISIYIWSRRSALHNNLGNIAREMVLPAYGLDKFQQSANPREQERFVEGLSALLSNDNFIRAGRLRRGTGINMTYELDEGSDELPYAHPAFGQYIGQAFLNKDIKGCDIPRVYFPDAVDQSEAEGVPRKAATIPMVAWTAAIIEHCLGEWTGGHLAKKHFVNKNLQPKYERHENGLVNSENIDGRDEVLALLYEEAVEWIPFAAPPVEATSTVSGSAEQAKALFAARKAARENQ
ncbi:hypothetical protein PENSPDRAFT_647837 [Peniophora sp. CONT]|nr:hypothetical protein PENSPDRAFT_647837 [Peniophora sp. CONT]